MAETVSNEPGVKKGPGLSKAGAVTVRVAVSESPILEAGSAVHACTHEDFVYSHVHAQGAL